MPSFACIDFVEQIIAAEHALVDVLGGEIEMVVVVPQRAQRLGRVADQVAAAWCSRP